MKKIFKAVACTLAAVLLISGCGGGAASQAPASDAPKTGPVTINLYSGGSDNVKSALEKIITAFQATEKDITVKLQFIPSGSGNAVDNLLAAIQAKATKTDIDVMDFGENEIRRVLEAGETNGIEALSPIAEDKIPNLKSLVAKPSIGSDKAMAFRGTTVVLAYNSEKVPNPPKTAEELYQWIKANPQRFAYNDPNTGGAGQSFVNTCIYNQMPEEAITSNDPKWKDEWTKGFELLKELHPFMYKASGKVQYPAKNQGTLDLLASGEVDIIPAWADMALKQIKEGTLPATTKICQIEPSLTGNVQVMVCPAMSQNKDAAYKFMNFCISPEGQQIFVSDQAAIPVIDPTQLSKETMDILTGFTSAKFRVITTGDLDTELKIKWQEDIATLP